jgi:NADH-quinone oxidoreductase subunit N
MSLFQIILPEIVLVTAACALFLLGFLGAKNNGRLAAMLALLGVAIALVISVTQYKNGVGGTDKYQNFRVSDFGLFIRVIALGIGTLILLLSWPWGPDAEGNSSVHYGKDAGEYFGLILLALTGLILVPSANDLIVLFMAIELASIPTYILVAASRPVSAAQEAGVKYFFLGAMAAAVMLMGFAYLYGTTGTTNLHEIGLIFAGQKISPVGAPVTTPWQLLAGVLLVVGIGFKLAAVPMHAYVADVYQGAATPVTALIGFVPKTTGIIALTKLLYIFAGASGAWMVAPQLGKLVWVLAALTMTVGNLLAISQENVKRMLAYSSVAHSGYLLTGLTFMLMGSGDQRLMALQAVLFYLAVYGLASTAAFGALQWIPSRRSIVVGDKEFAAPATTAETMEDLAGVGRSRPLVAMILALAAFSLVGLPLTGGFWGKYYLLAPIFGSFTHDQPSAGWLMTLAILILVNSAISAVYYLSIVGALFNRAEPDAVGPRTRKIPLIATASIVLSAAAVLFFGVVLSGTRGLADHAAGAAGAVDTVPETLSASH